jgi:hypothetical protein
VLSMPGAGVRDTWQFTSSSMHWICYPGTQCTTQAQRVEARPRLDTDGAAPPQLDQTAPPRLGVGTHLEGGGRLT